MTEFYEKNKKLISPIVFLLIYLFIVIFITLLALTWGRGAESEALIEKSQSYWHLAGWGCLLLVVMSLTAFFVHKKKSKTGLYKYLGWIDGLVNDFDKGVLSEVPQFNFLRKIRWQLVIFLPFFIILGYFGITQTGIPFAEMQITEISAIWISVEPASGEIMWLAVIISLVFGITNYLAFMNSWKFNPKAISVTFSLVLGTLYGYLIHLLRYFGSDADLFAVIIFWFTASLLITMFGGIIIAWIFKDINNMFQKLKALALSDDTILILVGTISLFVWSLILTFTLMNRKKKEV